MFCLYRKGGGEAYRFAFDLDGLVLFVIYYVIQIWDGFPTECACFMYVYPSSLLLALLFFLPFKRPFLVHKLCDLKYECNFDALIINLTI